MMIPQILLTLSAVAGVALGHVAVHAESNSLMARGSSGYNQCFDTYPSGGWASPVYTIGDSSTADAQCAMEYGIGDYTPLAGIEVWRTSDGDHIAGIQFTYASGKTSQIYGNEDTSNYASQSFTIAPGDLIKNAELFGNGDGTYLGAMHLETEGGKTFDAGKDTDGLTSYGINTGGGLLWGAIITPKDGDIGNMAWLFMKDSIDHISITDVKFSQDIAASSAGIDPQNIVVGRWYNDQAVDASYALSPAYSVVRSFSYSQTVTTAFGASISIEISDEIFGIGVKETDSFTWSMSIEDSSTTATSSATSVTCAASGTIKPSSGVQIKGAYQTGTGTWSYTSKVTIYLKGGGSFSYNENGQLDNTAYNECTTTLEPYNEDDTDGNTSNLELANNLGIIYSKGGGLSGQITAKSSAKTTGKTTAAPSSESGKATSGGTKTSNKGYTGPTTGHNSVTKPTSHPSSSMTGTKSSSKFSSGTRPMTTSKTTLKSQTSQKSTVSSKSTDKATTSSKSSTKSTHSKSTQKPTTKITGLPILPRSFRA